MAGRSKPVVTLLAYLALAFLLTCLILGCGGMLQDVTGVLHGAPLPPPRLRPRIVPGVYEMTFGSPVRYRCLFATGGYYEGRPIDPHHASLFTGTWRESENGTLHIIETAVGDLTPFVWEVDRWGTIAPFNVSSVKVTLRRLP